jgi:hypothetical protein
MYGDGIIRGHVKKTFSVWYSREGTASAMPSVMCPGIYANPAQDHHNIMKSRTIQQYIISYFQIPATRNSKQVLANPAHTAWVPGDDFFSENYRDAGYNS